MEILIKEDGCINYLIEAEPNKEVSLDFKVWQVNSWTMENEPCKDDLEIFIGGTIKLDGCSHIYFGDEDGYLHLCGRKYFDDMKKVLDAVWEKAEKEVTGFDKDVTSYIQ